MKRFILPKDYSRRNLDISKMHIYLIEGSPNLLNTMSPTSKAKSREYLEKMGVEVMTQTTVAASAYDGKVVILGDGRSIPTALLIWAAGVKGNVPPGIDPTLVAGNRIKVDDQTRSWWPINIFVRRTLSHADR